jgi:hypothetical protein
VITALGLPRTPQSYASVSRSLARLRKAGAVVAYDGEVLSQGRGYRYALPPPVEAG